MRLALRLGWRATRGAGRHALAVVASVALGVGALVAVGGFAADLGRTLAVEGRTLLGGDLELRAARPLDAPAAAVLDRVVARGARVAQVRELVAMARDPAGGQSALVEVKAVDGAYPLYGRLETRPAAPVAALLGGDGALVEAALLERLGLGVGAGLDVGEARVTVRGVVTREPDRAGGLFTLGPRVLLAAETLDRAGLVAPGSRVRYRTLLRLPARLAAGPAREALARELADPALRIAAWDEAQPGLRRFFDQMTTWLGLVGMVSLLVGAIGVAAAVRAFLGRALLTVAILKCVGATSRTLLGAFLLQALALGLLGSLAGAALGLVTQPLVAHLATGLVPFPVAPRADAWTLLRGVTMGVTTTLLVALWPLLAVRRVPPSLVLRQEVEALPGRRPWAAVAPIVAGLVALAVWQAGSLTVGGLFAGACAAALLLLAGVARALTALARRLPRVPSLAWRQGLANLHRPGGHAQGVIVALGVGVMLLVAVGLLEVGLARQMDHERRPETPSFFFVDLQADQRAAFVEAVTAASGGVAPEVTPLIRARVVELDGERVTRALVERRRSGADDRGFHFTHDYALTALADLPAGNVVVRGRWWTPAERGGPPAVSIEEEAARRLGVDVGSRLVFDVQGVELAATVASLRRVEWQRLTANFFMILSPGALDGAPVSYLATARVPLAAERGLQDRVAAAFPSVTAIPVRDVLERVAEVVDRIALAVRAVALVSVGAGLAVMVGALAASRAQRLAESALLRALGATRGVVARVFAVEYACLGLAAGVAGSLLAVVLAWCVLRLVLDVPWVFVAGVPALGVALATGLALAVGGLGTWRLLGVPPLAVLRRE